MQPDRLVNRKLPLYDSSQPRIIPHTRGRRRLRLVTFRMDRLRRKIDRAISLNGGLPRKRLLPPHDGPLQRRLETALVQKARS